MNSKLQQEVSELLAAYVDVSPVEFKMDADLDLVYDIDSTEMTELAMKIEQRFGTKVAKSDRQDWVTGQHICEFLLARQAVAA